MAPGSPVISVRDSSPFYARRVQSQTITVTELPESPVLTARRELGPAKGDLLRQPLTMKASVAASSLNLINNVVGAGLFSMPWTMKRASLAGGVALCTYTCFINSISYYLLARCCDMSGSFTYLDIGTRCFGASFGIFAQICVLLYSLGSCLSFVVLVGDFLAGETGVFGGSRALIILLVAALVFFPLSLLRNTESLKWSSLVSFFACFAAALLIIWTQVMHPPEAFLTQNAREGTVTVNYYSLGADAWAAVPVVNVAFTAHYNAPRFYLELQDRSIKRYLTVVVASMVFSLVTYASVGVCGYMAFGEETQGSILLNFAPKWWVAVAARLLLAIVVVFTFPLANHAVRDSAFSLFTMGRLTTNNAPFKPYVAVTLLLVVFAAFAGITFDRIESILAVKGALFGTCVVYVLPPLMYARLSLEQRSVEEGSNGSGSGDDGSLEGNDTEVRLSTETVQMSPLKKMGSVSLLRLLEELGWLGLLPLWGIGTCLLSLHSLVYK